MHTTLENGFIADANSKISCIIFSRIFKSNMQNYKAQSNNDINLWMIYKPGTLRKHFSTKRTSEIWVGQLPYFVMFSICDYAN